MPERTPSRAEALFAAAVADRLFQSQAVVEVTLRRSGPNIYVEAEALKPDHRYVAGHSASRLDLREGLPESAGFHVAGILLHRLGVE